MKVTARSLFAVVILSWLLVPSRPSAHHALAAIFDPKKPVTVSGTVTYVNWTFPHVWLYVDVKDANGKVTTWGINGGSPSSLKNHGWSRELLKPGDQVVVEGSAAINGQALAAARTITLANGTKIVVGAR